MAWVVRLRGGEEGGMGEEGGSMQAILDGRRGAHVGQSECRCCVAAVIAYVVVRL